MAAESACAPRTGQALLVRHAETPWSAAGRHTGRTDIPLTPAGREAAARLRPRLAIHAWALVLTSPLERARETCQLAGLGEQAAPRDGLLEWDYGDYEGLTTAQIRAQRPDWDLWREGCPGGESPQAVAGRVDPLVAELGRALEDGGDVAVFSHGHLLRVLTARWLGLGPAAGALWALGTGGLSQLGYERERRVIRRWNTE